jgi:hypothetical protein
MRNQFDMTGTLRDVGIQCIADDQRPWVPFVPYTELAWVKLYRVDPDHGEFITVLRAAPGVELPPCASSGPTTIYTLQGRWKYREADWIAGPGSLVTEGATTRRTLLVLADGTDDAILVMVSTGQRRFVDRAGNLVGAEDWHSAAERHLGHCRERGIGPPLVVDAGGPSLHGPFHAGSGPLPDEVPTPAGSPVEACGSYKSGGDVPPEG